MQALAGRTTVDGLLAIMHKVILHISQQRKRPCKELKKIQNKNMLHFFFNDDTNVHGQICSQVLHV